MSLCAFPLRNQEQIYGFVGFDAVRQRRDWQEEVIELGCTIGGLIGIALGHGKMHRALVDSEARYRALFESLADTVIVVDTATQSIVDANPQATTLTGRSIADLRTLLIAEIHPPELAEMAQQHLQASERDERIVTTELAVRHRDGHLIPVEVRSAGHYQAGKQSLVVSLYRDISERKRAEASIRHMAQHDPPTGLPNRAHFGHLIESALESARSAQSRLALLYLEDGADAATLSRHADQAMYQAKAAGKNSFSFYRAVDPASLT